MCAPGEEYAQFRKKRETRKQDQSYDLGLAGIKPCRFFYWSSIWKNSWQIGRELMIFLFVFRE
ncbi:hypothetical protein HMPREF1633_15065 [Tissierellia bacterium S5-A11]|nr:hypothetical protein HMPREF1633_15065 [Tissierellia bacterium S5-A11]